MSKVARTRSPTESSSSASPRDDDRRKTKRTRVALACLRCRSRKQKCDGAQDTCSTCKRLGVRCQYIAHPIPRPDQKRLYIKNLENHIAELESLLAGSGYDVVTIDHWKEKRNAIRRDSYLPDDVQTGDNSEPPAVMHDPIWNTTGNGEIESSDQPAERIYSSIIRSDLQPALVRRDSKTISLLSQLAAPEMAKRLLHGWIEHMSTQYPVVHTPWLEDIQSRPTADLDVFEASILHLVYANSGRILEAVCALTIQSSSD